MSAGLACQTLLGLPRAARPSGRFAEGKTPQRGVGLNMRQGLARLYQGLTHAARATDSRFFDAPDLRVIT